MINVEISQQTSTNDRQVVTEEYDGSLLEYYNYKLKEINENSDLTILYKSIGDEGFKLELSHRDMPMYHTISCECRVLNAGKQNEEVNNMIEKNWGLYNENGLIDSFITKDDAIEAEKKMNRRWQTCGFYVKTIEKQYDLSK